MYILLVGCPFCWHLFVPDKIAVHLVDKHGFALQRSSAFEVLGLPQSLYILNQDC
jgi:hypothetical protein